MSWPVVELGSVVSFIGGSQPPKSTFKYEPEDGYVRLLQIRDYKSDNNITYIPKSSTKKFCEKNDVMIGRYGPPVFQILRGLEGAYNVALMKAVPSEKVDEDYLYYFLKQDKLFRLIDGLSQRTAGQSGIDMDALKSYPMLLPPLAEQKRIAVILDKADAIRQKRQQAIKLADEFLRSVFLDMFGDPVTNPNGWEVKKLGELIISGPTNGLYKPSTAYGSGTRILRIDGFYDGELVEQTEFKRVNVTNDELTKFGLSERSIVINRVNSPEYLGKCAFIFNLDEKTVFESNMMNFMVNEELVNPRFLVQQLQMANIKQQIMASAKHAVNQSSINQQDVKNFKILIPKLSLQDKFESIALKYIESKNMHKSHLDESNGLFNSLSRKAFSGQL